MSQGRYKPGSLNPQVERFGSDYYEFDADEFNFFAMAKEAMQKTGEATRNSHTGVAKYRAVVLRISKPDEGGKRESEASERYKFKVRIPELHKFPDPCQSVAQLPENEEDLDPITRSRIDLHPDCWSASTQPSNTNEGQSGDIYPRPSVGDIVWVEFEKSPAGGRQASLVYAGMCRPADPTTPATADGTVANNLRVGCAKLQKLLNGPEATSMGAHANGSTPGSMARVNAPPVPYDPSNARSPAERAALAKSYDDDGSLPNKEQHAGHLATLHPDFQPVVKSFIYRCWSEKSIQIRLNSAYRSSADQARLRREWIERGKTDPQPTTKISYHQVGWAIDFNPTLSNGTTILSKSPQSEWIDSGLVAIATEEGLQWGGYWRSNYDPIHLDWKPGAPMSKNTFYSAASAAGVEPNVYSVADARNSAQV